MLVHAIITSRVDYYNSLLYGLPNYQLNKLQRILNTSARLVCNAPRFCHISPLRRGLHLLPVKARIEFKILLITFKAIHGLAPKYLCDLQEKTHRACTVSIPESSIQFLIILLKGIVWSLPGDFSSLSWALRILSRMISARCFPRHPSVRKMSSYESKPDTIASAGRPVNCFKI